MTLKEYKFRCECNREGCEHEIDDNIWLSLERIRMEMDDTPDLYIVWNRHIDDGQKVVQEFEQYSIVR